MPAPKQLIIRISVDVSETDYGASLSHASTKFRMGEGNHLLIPSMEAGEAARTMTQQAFNLGPVGTAYDALMKALADDANPDREQADGEG